MTFRRALMTCFLLNSMGTFAQSINLNNERAFNVSNSFTQSFIDHSSDELNFSIPVHLLNDQSNIFAENQTTLTLDQVISKAQENLVNSREGNHWNLPSFLGNHFSSKYFLYTKWMGETLPPEHIEALKNELLSSQNPDGSWTHVVDANIPQNLRGEVSPTVINYFALKVMGFDTKSEKMLAAKKFILSHGGIEKTNLFGKIFLALFNNYDWKQIRKIPFLIFNDSLGKVVPIASSNQFAQWINPHLMPIAYLRDRLVGKNLGPQFRLDELYGKKIILNYSTKITVPKSSEEELIFKILEKQEKHGSWGAYGPATIFTTMALNHYAKSVGKKYLYSKVNYVEVSNKARAFLKLMNVAPYPTQHKGILDDGKLWDTVLATWALGESKYPMKNVSSVNNFWDEFQVKNGGFLFGLDFDATPDTDDTAVAIMAMIRSGKVENWTRIKKAEKFILNMQNDDGGWGAFAKNNNPNPIVEFLAKDFLDSADLYDEASPDVTGHILEALGELGHKTTNSTSVSRAINYLRAELKKYPAYFGRWGINYIYGTSAVISGLHAVGLHSSDPLIAKPIAWLKARQNADGGFGESSLSYQYEKWRGRGISTATQTAWALLALINAGLANEQCARNAANYLIREFNKYGRWISPSVTGTGHPGVLYMTYPSYDLAFPLLAISKYKQASQFKH